MAVADDYDCFLLDLDGVLYRSDEAVPGAPEAVDRLRSTKRVAFITNNSGRTPQDVSDRLTALGIHASPSEVVTSALATASLLAGRHVGSAFVVGETGIRTALADAGIIVVDGDPDTVECVVLGWDRSADYGKLKRAALLVQRGAALVATNADAAYPAPDGLWPGAGALLAAITTTTGAQAEVVGKPHAPLFEMARVRAGGGRALVVGDRLDTDMAGAEAIGWDTMLVLSGVTGRADLLRTDTLPTHTSKDVTGLFSVPVVIRSAGTADRDRVETLLESCGLETGGGWAGPDRTILAERGGEIVGTVTVELAGHDAHLRSLAVEPRVRHGSVATVLCAHVARKARRSGGRSLYAVTETAGPFFAALGFRRAGSLQDLPDAFRAHMSFCPDGAELFRLELAITTSAGPRAGGGAPSERTAAPRSLP